MDRLLLLCALVCCSLVAASASSVPTLPSDFYTKLTSVANGGVASNSEQWYNGSKNQSRVDVHIPGVNTATQAYSFWNAETLTTFSTYELFNTLQCQKYVTPMDTTEGPECTELEDMGPAVINGTKTERYTAQCDVEGTSAYTMDQFWIDNETPYALVFNTTTVLGTYVSAQFYTDFDPTAPPQSVFVLPPECSKARHAVRAGDDELAAVQFVTQAMIRRRPLASH
eukprot:TRINITY_DN12730_c1_g1_i7.p1 TRINITY_DN12730_c1_g1~~TRINITY_DN12730_c1_g1_i7.p1  ORF type:complete len:241 (+),score=62.82 TRINITY_DN12730_c1_g1_i7:48-725(+)